MEYIYLDCENIAPRTLEALGPEQKVFLFLGEKQKKPDRSLTESIHAGGDKVEIIHISSQGNNALDFHIAYYLGRHAHADPKASFTIVSKDKGFDPLVKHMGTEGFQCARMERMPVAQAVRTGLGERTAAFIAHLDGLAAKTRPKKAARLKAYIRHWLGKDGALAEDVYDSLLAGNRFSDADGKLAYARPPEPPNRSPATAHQ
jgi:PIN domain-containing protein